MNNRITVKEEPGIYAIVSKRTTKLETENARLREAIKLAMHEITKEDYDEAYHQLYKGLDPNFERLDVHR